MSTYVVKFFVRVCQSKLKKHETMFSLSLSLSLCNSIYLLFAALFSVVLPIIVDACLRLMPLFKAGLVDIVAATASNSEAESAL